MKPTRHLVLGIAFFTSAVTLAHAATNPAVLGLPPGDLLSVLPPPPRGWKLISSIGKNEVSPQPTVLTFAIREYRLEPPPPTPGQPASPPKITTITLLDTALDPARAFVFDAFKPNAAATQKSSRYQDTPLIERQLSDSKRQITLAIDARFICTLILQNQDDQNRDAWLQALNLPALREWAQKAPRLTPPADILQVSYINELNPKTNQTLSLPSRPPN